MTSVETMREWLDDVRYLDYAFTLQQDVGYGGRVWLQASFYEKDIVTGKLEAQFTRKWIISLHMTKSEVIQTAFKCALTSAEHSCREHFRYKGSAVFSPHFDVDELEQLCKRQGFDYREAP